MSARPTPSCCSSSVSPSSSPSCASHACACRTWCADAAFPATGLGFQQLSGAVLRLYVPAVDLHVGGCLHRRLESVRLSLARLELEMVRVPVPGWPDGRSDPQQYHHLARHRGGLCAHGTS